jgi:glycerophosphoryl diester phosphodiesterase
MGAGAAGDPENSVPSLVHAFEAGASAVEFDVQLTRDGEVVVAHDPRLSRIADSGGCVAEQTLAELRAPNLLAARRTVSAAHMPTLGEALAAIRPFDSPARSFLADVHVKVYDGLHGDLSRGQVGCPATDWQTLARRTVETVGGMGMLDRVLFTSFDPRVLDTMQHARAQGARTGLLALWGAPAVIHGAEGRFDAVVLHVTPPDERLYFRAHHAGLALYSWTPDSTPALCSDLRARRVDGVITDRLDRALAINDLPPASPTPITCRAGAMPPAVTAALWPRGRPPGPRQWSSRP